MLRASNGDAFMKNSTRNILISCSLLSALCTMLMLSGCDDSGSKELLHPVRNDAPRFEGDSMTAGVNWIKSTSTVEKIYNWQADFKGAEINGVSGATLEHIRSNIIPFKTPVVVLFAGFNNIKHLEQSEADIVAAYALVLIRLHDVAENVYCIGVPPMVHSRSDSWFPEGADISNARIIGIDAQIHKLCGDNYIDTPSFWTESDSDDGIHPNMRGYKKIVAELKGKKSLRGVETGKSWREAFKQIFRVFRWSFKQVGELIWQ